MQPEQTQQSNWQFNPGNTTQNNKAANSPSQSDKDVSWTASEFISYQKTSGWYLIGLVAILAIASIIFLLTRDWISAVSVFIAGSLFLVFAARKPRVLQYQIDKNGIHIADKLYAFTTLRSFSIIEEDSLRSISVYPLKRFMPAISMYFDPQDESKITEALASYLPQEVRKQDPIDKLMHKIRF